MLATRTPLSHRTLPSSFPFPLPNHPPIMILLMAHLPRPTQRLPLPRLLRPQQLPRNLHQKLPRQHAPLRLPIQPLHLPAVHPDINQQLPHGAIGARPIVQHRDILARRIVRAPTVRAATARIEDVDVRDGVHEGHVEEHDAQDVRVGQDGVVRGAVGVVGGVGGEGRLGEEGEFPGVDPGAPEGEGVGVVVGELDGAGVGVGVLGAPGGF